MQLPLIVPGALSSFHMPHIAKLRKGKHEVLAMATEAEFLKRHSLEGFLRRHLFNARSISISDLEVRYRKFESIEPRDSMYRVSTSHLEVEAVLGSSLEKMTRYQSAQKRDLYRAIEVLGALQGKDADGKVVTSNRRDSKPGFGETTGRALYTITPEGRFLQTKPPSSFF